MGIISCYMKQDAQLSQRARAAGCVIVFAKSRRLELGHNILSSTTVIGYNRPHNTSRVCSLSCASLTAPMRQARSQDFILRGPQKLRRCTFFSKKVDDLFCRRPQNWSFPSSGVHIDYLRYLRPTEHNTFNFW